MKKFFLSIVLIICLTIFGHSFSFAQENFSAKKPLNSQITSTNDSFGVKKEIKKGWRKLVKTQMKLNMSLSKATKTMKNQNSPKVFLGALLIAFFYGILHALGPGHGKAVVVSYFLSKKEKIWKVPLMALQVASTHVLSAIAFVLLADITLKQIIINPEAQIYWFKLVSYFGILGVGIWMLFNKIKKSKSCFEKNQDQSFLAISAGLVPCVGSLLIMLYSMANNMLFVGILLVLAIGFGIALTVSISGLVAFMANRCIGCSFQEKKYLPIINILEIIGPVFVICIGVFELYMAFLN